MVPGLLTDYLIFLEYLFRDCRKHVPLIIVIVANSLSTCFSPSGALDPPLTVVSHVVYVNLGFSDFTHTDFMFGNVVKI